MDVESTKLSAEEMSALMKRLGGKAGLQRFLRGELTLVEARPREFPIWETVRLGRHKTAAAYSKALKPAGTAASLGDNYLGHPAFECARQETDVDLAMVSVGELGFMEGALYSQIVERALALGLELCPAEVGRLGGRL